MQAILKPSFFILLLVSSLSAQVTRAQDDIGESRCISAQQDIADKLKCLPGVSSEEVKDGTAPDGVRYFELSFTQPVDHEHPEAGNFQQRVALLHRGENEPMVLQTSGYSIFGVRQAAITSVFATNQIQIEHRFFSTSVPAVMDWSKLNIRQSAADFHAITLALKQIYSSPWVNTGASKGGMTSVYHRRFYPNDVVGTVADVAPHSYTRYDQRFVDFVANVGGDDYKQCRENLKSVQIDVLKNRNAFLDQIQGDFSHMGNKNLVLEHSVIDAVFAFWQYGDPDMPGNGCKGIPVNGSLQDKFNFLQLHSDINTFTDSELEGFLPYYYQAATELGAPENYTSHLEPYRLFEYRIEQYAPKNTPLDYSNASMVDVDNWLRTEADRIIFVYGTLDPWSAGEMPVSTNGKNTKKYFVKKGNHGSNFVRLSSDDRSEVIQTLKSWLQNAPVVQVQNYQLLPRMQSLEELEFQVRRRHRL